MTACRPSDSFHHWTTSTFCRGTFVSIEPAAVFVVSSLPCLRSGDLYKWCSLNLPCKVQSNCVQPPISSGFVFSIVIVNLSEEQYMKRFLNTCSTRSAHTESGFLSIVKHCSPATSSPASFHQPEALSACVYHRFYVYFSLHQIIY